MSATGDQRERQARWYFGGLASTVATICTHQLDTIKLVLQTKRVKSSAIQITYKIMREHGPVALYQGLSAAILRSLTNSMTRFGLYETGKTFISTVLAGVSGTVGGLLGTSADMPDDIN